MGRDDEVKRIRRALLSPRARLLVHGERRAGKTWALAAARSGAEERGGAVLTADLSTASAVSDVAGRVLAAAARSLRRSWTDVVGELVGRLELAVRLDPDPDTGEPVPSLEPGLRRRPAEEQWRVLGRVLEILDRMAARGTRTLGLVLDGFEVIPDFGGSEAEARLRDTLAGHRNVSYVLAGGPSDPVLELVDGGRPLHGFFGLVAVRAVDPGLLAGWVDERMEAGGRSRPGTGERCVALAGPRIGDVVRLARACFRAAEEDGPGDPEALAGAAFRSVVEDVGGSFRALWRDLTPYQQNVVRAVAAGERGLTTSETLDRFALGHSGSASNAAGSLVRDGLLVRADTPVGYDLDSPFFRGWVVAGALPDVGIFRSPEWRPGGSERGRASPSGP